MLSICIPVYNYSVVELVNSLVFQVAKINKQFEIIVIDDASELDYKKSNSQISTLKDVKYIQLPKNIGRSKIRNMLAEIATHNFLLFLDSNTKIENDFFLENYIKFINDETVVIGGIQCCDKPFDKSFLLRWTYSKKRESIMAEKRQKRPYRNFIAKNFLIPKSVFNHIKFDEDISGYGHEDTLFGLKLKQLNVPILHINNALLHSHLENNNVFLLKTEEGIDNLLKLYRNKKNDVEFINSIKLLRFYNRMGTLNKWFISLVFKKFKLLIRMLLFGKHPNMLLFDFYKIGYLCSLNNSLNPEQ